MVGIFKIYDAHLHFYSNSYFRYLIRQKPNRLDINSELKQLAGKGHLEIPGEDPLQLAQRWVEILDKWKIERSVLIGSIPGDEDSVVQAVKAFPKRFAGLFAVDPNSNVLVQNATQRLKNEKLKGFFLYPSLYQIQAGDPWLDQLYAIAAETKAVAYIHFGRLILRTRDFAGIPTVANEEFSNPEDLIPVAKKYPAIRFIVPNFGAGKFEQLLRVGKECPNVFVDSAGANSWIQQYPEPLDLRGVFQKMLGVFGPSRVLFGSDSGMLPRAYRYDILDNQLKLLQEMRVPNQDIKKIFYENAAGLFGE